jgi:hypothetical protein
MPSASPLREWRSGWIRRSGRRSRRDEWEVGLGRVSDAANNGLQHRGSSEENEELYMRSNSTRHAYLFEVVWCVVRRVLLLPSATSHSATGARRARRAAPAGRRLAAGCARLLLFCYILQRLK